jgi:hypothetical protein
VIVFGDIPPTVVGMLSTGILSTAAVCVRQVLRNRAERERWHATERLVDRLGLDALKALPNLARELRDPSPVDALTVKAERRLPGQRRRTVRALPSPAMPHRSLSGAAHVEEAHGELGEHATRPTPPPS